MKYKNITIFKDRNLKTGISKITGIDAGCRIFDYETYAPKHFYDLENIIIESAMFHDMVKIQNIAINEEDYKKLYALMQTHVETDACICEIRNILSQGHDKGCMGVKSHT